MKTLNHILTFCCLVLITLTTLAFNLNAQTPFTHNTQSSNITRHMTTLNNASTNGKPDALVFVSQVYGKYNTHQVGVWYSGGKWIVYNEDKAAMPVNTNFNVVALPASDKVFLHKATSSNITNNWTTIDHPKANNNPNAVIIVTQRWLGTYNTKAIGVWYTSGGKWAIYNQDKSPMPNGTAFNVMVVDEGRVAGMKASASILTANSATKTHSLGGYIAVDDYESDIANKVFITQNWQAAGPYNNHIPGVWYTGKAWSVYNQDKKDLPNNAKFNVLSFSKKVNGYKANVAVFNNGKGSFVQVGAKKWEELGADGGTRFNFIEVARDEWSVYLEDRSRNVAIQLDYHTMKVMYGIVGQKKTPLYNITNARGGKTYASTSTNSNTGGTVIPHTKPTPTIGSTTPKIYIPGTKQEMTVDQLKGNLRHKGFTLVQTNELQPNQCAIVYPQANADDISAELGLLMCVTQIGDNVTLSQAVVHGSCDAANPLNQGAGAKCQVGVLKQDLKVKFNGGETSFKVAGPSAEACSAVSTEFVCYSAGATLASTSFEVTDDRGNGVGIGVSAGVGYGLNTSYEDGVISSSVDLKILAGASLTFSVNVEDAQAAVTTVGETGYVLVKDNVVAASGPVISYYNNELESDVKNASNKTIGYVEVGGKYVVQGVSDGAAATGKFLVDAGSTIANGAENFGKDVVKEGEDFGNGAKDVGNDIIKGIGGLFD